MNPVSLSLPMNISTDWWTEEKYWRIVKMQQAMDHKPWVIHGTGVTISELGTFMKPVKLATEH